MRVLIADDDIVIRHALRAHLQKWKYDVIECPDGRQAWKQLQEPNAPRMAIVDWNMPGTSGLELCQKVRQKPSLAGMYMILLTGNQDRHQIVTGLDSGADDYITKPFHWDELAARLRIGTRIVSLQHTLATRVQELQDALTNVKQLNGLLPICAYCKRIRDDRDYWRQIEQYLSDHSDAQFSHGICPDCLQQHLPSAT